jgi:hypothetical protein
MSKKLSRLAKQVLFDYNMLTEKLGGRAVAAGGADGMPDEMPMGYFDRHVSTLGQDFPLDPSPQTAVQLSTQKPPVADDAYMPADAPNLSLAIGALASEAQLDTAEIGMLYKTVKKMLDKYCAKKAGVIVQEALKPEDLSSLYDDEDDEDFDDDELADMMRSIDVQAQADVEKMPSIVRDELKLKPLKGDRKIQVTDDSDEDYVPEADPDRIPYLQQVMGITGHSGESGARQWAHKKTVLLGFLNVLHRHKGYRTVLGQFYKDFENAIEELAEKNQLDWMSGYKDAWLADAESISQLREPSNEQLGGLYRELFGKMFNSKFFAKMYDELMLAVEDELSTYQDTKDLSDKELKHLAKMVTGEVSQTAKNLAKAGIVDKNEVKSIEKKMKSKNPAEQYSGQMAMQKIQRKLSALMGKIGKYRNEFINDNVSSVAFNVYDDGNIKGKLPNEIKKLVQSIK